MQGHLLSFRTSLDDLLNIPLSAAASVQMQDYHGARIIAQGSIGDSFYVICEGSASVMVNGGDIRMLCIPSRTMVPAS